VAFEVATFCIFFTVLSLVHEDRTACKSDAPAFLPPHTPCTMPSPLALHGASLALPSASSVEICFLLRISNLSYRPDFNLTSLRDSDAHEDILTVSSLFTIRPGILLDVFLHRIAHLRHIIYIYIYTISNKMVSLLENCVANAWQWNIRCCI